MKRAPAPHVNPVRSAPPPAAARVAGALLMLACLGGLAWTLMTYYALYVFRTIPAPSQYNRTTLAEYGLRLEGLLELDPTNGEIRYRYASVLANQGDFSAAVRELQRARLTHWVQSSLFVLSEMYLKLGWIDQAVSTMGDCLLVNPVDREYNPKYLRLLYVKLKRWNPSRRQAGFDSDRRQFAAAVRNWAIRAPFDPNAYLFMGNYHIRPMPFYALQAYRCFLYGLSDGPLAFSGNTDLMIERGDVLNVIGQIIRGRFAPSYRDLP
ncbi:MAG: tetratricopeptide repeat protein [bacterium]|nr:tetratricopeptide repeat protein [bacterium]